MSECGQELPTSIPWESSLGNRALNLSSLVGNLPLIGDCISHMRRHMPHGSRNRSTRDSAHISGGVGDVEQGVPKVRERREGSLETPTQPHIYNYV